MKRGQESRRHTDNNVCDEATAKQPQRNANEEKRGKKSENCRRAAKRKLKNQNA